MSAGNFLAKIPTSLRESLLLEFNEIRKNYNEHKWMPSQLSGGRFCEIVYSILEGYASGKYPVKPKKPKNFFQSCRDLELNGNVPRSFQILIPRLLTGLYEIRNNRGVGHVGGDVNPNLMDATIVLSLSSWIMAELVRVFHGATTEEAQELVNALSERQTPLVWQGGNVKRVLNPDIKIREQVLILLGASVGAVTVLDLLEWTEYSNKDYFMKMLKAMHSKRLIEFPAGSDTVQLLPPGAEKLNSIVEKHSDYV